MKKIPFLLFLLVTKTMHSQTILFHDDFGTVAQNPMNRTGWITNNGGGSSWELRTTAASSGYSNASAGANVFTNLGNNLNLKSLTYDNNLSTLSYSLLVLKFGGIKTGTVPSLSISFSTDGVNFISFAGNTVSLTTSWTLYTIALPVTASHQSNLRIRIEIQANNNSTNNFRLDDLRMDGIADAPLPVRFSSFHVLKSGDKNMLQWSTSSEQDNLGFEIQRSLDGSYFNVISFVPSLAPAGNSSSELQYSFTDDWPPGWKQYYRLRQVDHDQRSTFSEVLIIRREGNVSWDVEPPFPDPATNRLVIPLKAPQDGSVQLSVVDLTGRVLIYKRILVAAGRNWPELTLDQLSQGRYVVIIRRDGAKPISFGFIKE